MGKVASVHSVPYFRGQEFYVFPPINVFGQLSFGEKEKLINELSDKYNKLMQFNYIISHNLRSPIANILGLVEVINIPSLCAEEKVQIIEYIKSFLSQGKYPTPAESGYALPVSPPSR